MKFDRLLFWMIAPSLVVGTAAFLIWAIFIQAPRVEAQHRALCEEHKMSSSFVSITQGKITTKNWFCYDKDGRVYYFGN